jgi:nicotinic acid phosphoribosyltransferase
MRAATCAEEHTLALKALREAGIRATSNVDIAFHLDMKPVGTMGHEHIQRWGNDLDAYRAMRDMRTGAPSYLLDTFDTITSGIPAAIKVMQEREHACSIRYDSGDKFAQYVYAHGEFTRVGLSPTHILEDGLDLKMTKKFEQLRVLHTGLAPEKQLYGYGGYLISRHWMNPLTRDRVSAVYKLTQTSGEPRMKFGNEAGLGKVSIPGHPVTWRRIRGSGPMSIIGQDGEKPPEDYVVLSGGGEDAVNQIKLCRAFPNLRTGSKQAYTLSPETQRLVEKLEKTR